MSHSKINPCKKIVYLSLGTLALSPQLAKAGTLVDRIKRPGELLGDEGKTWQEDVLTILTNWTKYIIGTVSAFAILMIIISGFQLILARGEEDKIGNAKKALTWSVAGLILAIFAFSIINIVVILVDRRFAIGE